MGSAAHAVRINEIWHSKVEGALSLVDRDELILEYAPLVKYVAQRVSSRLPRQVELDDLVCAGVLGLIDAIDKFDPSRGIAFKTYAELRIRGAILDELRDMDWVPRSIRKKRREVEQAYREVEQRLGRPAEDVEVAQELGIPVAELHELLEEVRGLTLGSFQEIGAMGGAEEAGDEGLLRFIADPEAEDPVAVCHREQLVELIGQAIDALPEKEREVMLLYYQHELTMKEAGEALNVTESRVSQLHTKAIIRIRKYLANLV
ncbi:MAG: FliA/WhiG family RNA polymerase sigma factor [Candidatus Schekmanbacteria bacterium]|nr:FliA/WhiG family RNA polymerase sigma factor [Candidatus Schekmanbacteria bacterium]